MGSTMNEKDRAETTPRKKHTKRHSPAKRDATIGKRLHVRKKSHKRYRNAADHSAENMVCQAENASPRKKQGSKKKKKNRKKSNIGLTLILLAVLIALVVPGVRQIRKYNEFKRMKAAVCVDVFYDGTIVDGIDISGMTMDEAMEYWENSVEPAYTNRSITLDNGTRRSAVELGYSSDYADVLSSAWSAERNGSIEERYEAICRHEAERNEYSVQRSFFDEATVRSFVDETAATIDCEAKNASLKAFNIETYQFEYNDDETGYVVNREKLIADIENTLNSGGGNVGIEVEQIDPEITKENVSSRYGMICSAVTNASSSSSNRISNISLALSYIDGTVLHPGETFSFNETVGERTKARGFKEAPAYNRGAVVDEVGGGICQVSTTIFNAAVKANLTIVERYPHSMTVSYVDPGKDAAVDWGAKDLKFKNDTDEDVYICCFLSSDKRVRVGIFGKLLPDGQSIIVETKKTKTVDYSTEYQLNFELAPGQTNVIQKGKKGAKATTYKVLLDANGQEIARQELFRSSYNPQNEIVEYGQ